MKLLNPTAKLVHELLMNTSFMDSVRTYSGRGMDGFAPVSKPRVIVAVMIDEPSAGKHYGGEVAAPIFARITSETLRALRVAPDAPFATLIQPVEPVRESL